VTDYQFTLIKRSFKNLYQQELVQILSHRWVPCVLFQLALLALTLIYKQNEAGGEHGVGDFKDATCHILTQLKHNHNYGQHYDQNNFADYSERSVVSVETVCDNSSH
jgi:hypothetical protein